MAATIFQIDPTLVSGVTPISVYGISFTTSGGSTIPACCVGMWDFQDTGTTLTDKSGKGNNGSACLTTNAAVNGYNTWSFIGSSYVTFASSIDDLDLQSAPYAVFGTVTFDGGDSYAVNQYLCMKNLDGYANAQYGLLYDCAETTSHAITMLMFGGRKNTTTADSVDPVTGTWYDLGGYWNGTGVQMYINCSARGTSMAASSESVTADAPNFMIGCRSVGLETGGMGFLEGKLFNIAIYAGSSFDMTAILAHRATVYGQITSA